MGRLIGPVQNIPLVVPVIQLDVLITNGNSGGPLLDLNGRVVGITNAGTTGGINFAIPSNIVKRVADSIIKTGKYEHPFVGYTGLTLTADSIKTSNVANVDQSTRGIMIVSVVRGSPAERAGLIAANRINTPNGQGYQANDIIVSVNGKQVKSLEDWASYIEESVSPGQTIQLGVLRSGSVVTLTVVPTVRS
jgi:S1-C subfamily serine protease